MPSDRNPPPARRPATWVRFLPALAVACGLQAAPAPPPLPPAPPAVRVQDPVEALAARIRAFTEAPRFAAAAWGIQVVSLDTGRVLFEHNAGKYFLPASNVKLFTAAMALQELGPDLRIRTSLYGIAAPDAGGIVPGDLVLYGRGDPTLMRPWNGGAYQADPFESLANQLQARGVREVRGDLVGDDSYFDAPTYGPGWEVEDLRYAYGAETSALTVHHSVLDLWVYPGTVPGGPCGLFVQPGQGLADLANRTRTETAGADQGVRADRAPGQSAIRVTGSLANGAPPVRLTVTVRDPALLAARLLGRALERHGIRVGGRARAVHAGDRDTALDLGRLVELGHLESPPLAAVLREMLKRSDNLYAQLVLLHAGARSGAPGDGDTVQRGLAALAAWMGRAGLKPGDAVLEEGAGLSRKNLVKPEAIVRLLVYMDRQPEAGLFRDCLPVAGVDGTLGALMGGTTAQGNLAAKTGTLRHTHALSGYVTGAGGERLAFAILLNNYCPEPGTGAPPAPAELGAILAGSPGGTLSGTP